MKCGFFIEDISSDVISTIVAVDMEEYRFPICSLTPSSVRINDTLSSSLSYKFFICAIYHPNAKVLAQPYIEVAVQRKRPSIKEYKNSN